MELDLSEDEIGVLYTLVNSHLNEVSTLCTYSPTLNANALLKRARSKGQKMSEMENNVRTYLGELEELENKLLGRIN